MMVTLAEYQWFLPAVIGSFHSRPIKFFTGFAMMIATLGNQIGQPPLCFTIVLVLWQLTSLVQLVSIVCLCKWRANSVAFTILFLIAGSFPFGNDISGQSDLYIELGARRLIFLD